VPQKLSSPDCIREVAAIITRLFNLYPTGDEPAEVRQAVAEAWLEELVEFDVQIVDEICREWRRGQTRRPTLAEIYRHCKEGQALADWRGAKKLRKPAGSIDPEIDRLWNGDMAARQQAIADQKARYEQAAAWRAAKREHVDAAFHAMPLEPAERHVSPADKERIRRESLHAEARVRTHRADNTDPEVLRRERERLRIGEYRPGARHDDKEAAA